MTVPDFLFGVLACLTIGYIPLARVLTQAAREKPSIWALTLFALLASIIAAVIVSYIAAVANSAAGYPVPQDIAKSVLRLLLVPLAAFPYLFFWVLKTGRFRDGRG